MARLIERGECPMRHENGNCTVAGGFCTAVNDPICDALHNAYACGKHAASRENESVKHGKWIGLEYDGYADGYPVWEVWECSECGNEIRTEEPPCFCCDCGARMDGE